MWSALEILAPSASPRDGSEPDGDPADRAEEEQEGRRRVRRGRRRLRVLRVLPGVHVPEVGLPRHSHGRRQGDRNGG